MTADSQKINRAIRLKNLVNALNITGKHLGEQIGISQGMISNLMNGKRAMTLELVDKITDRYTDVNPIWVLFGVGTMFLSQSTTTQTGIEEKTFEYGKSKPIQLQDLAEIILSIQAENSELRRRIEALEGRTCEQKKPLP